MYPEMDDWIRVRNEVDPEGMFVGDWHRRLLLPDDDGKPVLANEERKMKIETADAGGVNWTGHIPGKNLSPQTSEESFEMMHGVEAEKSMLFGDSARAQEEEGEEL